MKQKQKNQRLGDAIAAFLFIAFFATNMLVSQENMLPSKANAVFIYQQPTNKLN